MEQILAEYEINVEKYGMLHKRRDRECPILKYLGKVTLRKFKDIKPDIYLHVTMECLDRGSHTEPVNVYKHFYFEEEDCEDLVDALSIMLVKCYEAIRLYGKNS